MPNMNKVEQKKQWVGFGACVHAFVYILIQSTSDLRTILVIESPIWQHSITGQHWCNQIFDIWITSLDRFIHKMVIKNVWFIINSLALRLFDIRTTVCNRPSNIRTKTRWPPKMFANRTTLMNPNIWNRTASLDRFIHKRVIKNIFFTIKLSSLVIIRYLTGTRYPDLFNIRTQIHMSVYRHFLDIVRWLY
jgi:hypothetical protein